MGNDAAAPAYLTSLVQLAELSPDALLVVDSRGHIIVANSRVEQVFGYARDDLVGRTVETLVPERFRGSHSGHRLFYQRDPRARMMGEGRLDLRGLRKDGSEFPAEIALTSVTTDTGAVTAAAIRDVSERLRAERERAELEARLARQQAIAQASRMESIGQLAGGIAHDFNNLLSVVIGNVEFLIAQLQVGSPEHEEAMEILRASNQAATLTKQLLTFSRREVIEPEPVDLNATVTHVERLLRRTIGDHVAMVTDLAPQLPPVMSDPGGLEQILVNLAVNARDAMPNGGTVAITTRAVTIGAEDARTREIEPGDYVRLAVIDTGVGMSAEVAARAFEPFFSTKPKTQGTGLGLATVYAITRQVGGDVWIQSQLGIGTSIFVELPQLRTGASGEGSGAPKAERANPPVSGEQVLLVEDDQAVRRVAERILNIHGYAVTSRSSGAEAMELLQRTGANFDLLITDVIMPGMPGPELAQRARALHPGLSVVLMSGYVDPEIDVDQMSYAAIVQKPFTEASLAQALRKALHGP